MLQEIILRRAAIGLPTKIATCCHCGTKAMLRARTGQHTLTCGACGAPLRQLKMLPIAASAPKPAISHQPRAARPAYQKPVKPFKKRKKRKSLFRKIAEEAFDLVEDIFD